MSLAGSGHSSYGPAIASRSSPAWRKFACVEKVGLFAVRGGFPFVVAGGGDQAVAVGRGPLEPTGPRCAGSTRRTPPRTDHPRQAKSSAGPQVTAVSSGTAQTGSPSRRRWSVSVVGTSPSTSLVQSPRAGLLWCSPPGRVVDARPGGQAGPARFGSGLGQESRSPTACGRETGRGR